MDFLDELEGMAAHVATLDNDVDITKWQTLFGYTATESDLAVQRLQAGMDPVVSFALWDAVREQQQALGHDRLTYSHWITLAKRQTQQITSASSVRGDNREYLVQLEGPLSPEALSDLLSVREPLEILTAQSLDAGTTTRFARIKGTAEKVELLKKVHETAPHFSPLIITASYAKKDFCACSSAPFIGRECTLPQHRLEKVTDSALPQQHQYPVWYFFYGTLCSPETLRSLFAHLDPEGKDYRLLPAQIRGGYMATWGGGKYKALVDRSSADIIVGSAFLVESKEHEDALCFYETNSYDVVRCDVELVGGTQVIRGCTFRFIGVPD